jgi:hypothetical protein
MSDRNAPPPPPKPRASRGLKIALGLSLAFNLFVIGLAGGALLGRGEAREDRVALRMMGLAPIAVALPREARAELRGRIGAEAPDLRRERVAIGRSLRGLQRALLAEPFDRAEAARALSAARRGTAALQARGHAAALDVLEGLPAEERAVMAERLGRAMRRMAERAR